MGTVYNKLSLLVGVRGRLNFIPQCGRDGLADVVLVAVAIGCAGLILGG